MNIHGTGCGILDCIYADEDFSSSAYRAVQSVKDGDGGLAPGKLVFSSALEKLTGKSYDETLSALTGGKAPSTRNLGGPSAVSLAHAAQMLANRNTEEPFSVCYYGVRGNDLTGDVFEEKISALPFEIHLLPKDLSSSRVDVFSDPRYDNGSGERTFVYKKGILDELYPEDLGDDFFNAAIIAFGGTALTPRIHDNLTELLKRSRSVAAVTVVNLVYDYRSEIKAPGKKWKLGANDDAYHHIDLLLADQEEAVKTSGKVSVEEAAAWFLGRGCGAAIITRGRQPLLYCAGDSTLFTKAEPAYLPVCETIDRELAAHPEKRGDTTGCGDNFTGMVIAELAEALASGRHNSLDLREICIPAVAAGGFACFIVGGTYYEKQSGEKRRLLEPYVEAYRKQLGL
jgi:sugar/nucleoside kinase (ribokinase family)